MIEEWNSKKEEKRRLEGRDDSLSCLVFFFGSLDRFMALSLVSSLNL